MTKSKRPKVSRSIGTRKSVAQDAKRVVARSKKTNELAPRKRRVVQRQATKKRQLGHNRVAKKRVKPSPSTHQELQPFARHQTVAPETPPHSVLGNPPTITNIASPPASWLELGERYAPKTIDEVALPESVRAQLLQVIQANGPVNLLLAGPPGIGKSAAINLIVSKKNLDSYFVEATQDGTLESLRNTKTFATSVSFYGEQKCIVIEELDSASPPFMQALRGKTMTKGTGFLMTCNSLDKIPPPVKSRCTVIDLVNMTSQQRTDLQVAQLDRARAIVDAERGFADETTLETIVKESKGDFRMILQRLATLLADEPVLKRTARSSSKPSDNLSALAEHLADDTARLLDDLVALFNRFLLLPEGGIETLALAILHFWTIEAAQRSPILAFVSPQRECGKSTALNCVAMLVPRPAATVDLTPAALYKRTDAGDTLLIDEADKLLHTKSELSTLLKGGFERGATVFRHEVTYNLWSPKVVAKIGPIEDPPLVSRCIVIAMVRKLANEHRERLHKLRHTAEFEAMRKRCEFWALEAVRALPSLDPTAPASFGARQREKYEPLFAVAELAGPQWLAKAHQAAIAIESTAQEDEDIGSMLLADLRAIFDDVRHDKIRSAELVERLRAMADRPWSTSAGLPRKMARVLATYGIKSKNIRFMPDDQRKGFERTQFEAAWARYLPAADAEAGTDGTDGTDES